MKRLAPLIVVAALASCAVRLEPPPVDDYCNVFLDDSAKHDAIFAPKDLSCVPLNDMVGIRVACPQADGTEWSRVDFTYPAEKSTALWYYRYVPDESHFPVRMLCTVDSRGNVTERQ